jgi:hypothetical protein
MKPEQRFWAQVRMAWPGHAARIEAGAGGCDPGTPDCVLSVDGRGGWVELKVWPQPLEESQLPWHIDAMARGAYAVVLCWLGRDEVWVGRAEDYEYYQDRHKVERPPGVSLQEGLAVISCALTRRR